MLGVDVSRYQASGSIDWAAWKRAGVGFVWVKGTDGGGRAPVETADRKVRDAKTAGVPIGLYGYAQLSPSPEAQADVLIDECIKLGAFGIMPALDLEDPHPATAASRPFAVRYLNRMRVRGIARPVLYGNKSMLTAINADSIRLEVPGTIIWLAEYGLNNGVRRPQTYRGHVDVHQYTSVGRLPGYSGNLDLNEAFNTAIFATQEDGMELTDKITFWDGLQITVGQALADTWQLINNLSGRPTRPNTPADTTPWITALLAEVTNDPDLTADAIAQIIRDNAPPPAPIDWGAVKQAVRDAAGEDNPALADAIADNLVARLTN